MTFDNYQAEALVEIAKTRGFDAYKAAVRALEDAGKGEEVLASFRERAESGDPESAFELGMLLVAQGKPEQAIEEYRNAAERGHVVAMNSLGAALIKSGWFDEAEHWLKRGVKGGSLGAFTNLAMLYDVLGRFPAAETLYRAAAKAGNKTAASKLAGIADRAARYGPGNWLSFATFGWPLRDARPGMRLWKSEVGTLMVHFVPAPPRIISSDPDVIVSQLTAMKPLLEDPEMAAAMIVEHGATIPTAPGPPTSSESLDVLAVERFELPPGRCVEVVLKRTGAAESRYQMLLLVLFADFYWRVTITVPGRHGPNRCQRPTNLSSAVDEVAPGTGKRHGREEEPLEEVDLLARLRELSSEFKQSLALSDRITDARPFVENR